MGKNFTKKLLPLALTAAMIVPSVPAMAAPSDIAGHWAESVITQWQRKGLIQGYEDGTFKPGNTITRAEFVTLMNNAKGFWSEGGINFSDVKNGSWFYSAVARAVAAGYVKGYSDGSFKPNNTITRAEAAVMIANTAKLSANEAGAYRFTDIGSIPAWARGSVGAVVAAGYMTGYPDGSFDANASISRAEAVSSLNRMLGGTAYQPTQPTTPTTDTTKTTSDDVVIENKGTTLKNQTVDGNVTIAKSVGNGDVTLRNVTIKGDLIVKGGGSNTVTLEDVDVRGKVRLLKEGVHLHLVGDTDIRKLLIDLAARITQSSSYKDEIDEIILAGDGDLNKTTRIDVPAKQLRIENQADLILGGDVEKLIVDEDAKGAEIEIKKGTTVNELNTDAKIKLTGKGRIDLLDVSASGVTFDKNLNIRKTDTSNGATAPKENGSTSTGGNSGGSSGGSSGTASKEITGAEKVTRDVPYGTSADDALAAIPKTVTLKLKGGSTTTTTVTNWKWADGVSYNTTPTENTNYKATTTVTIPSGYTYNGTLTAEATVTVHPLDKTKLEAAKNAYMDLQNKQTYDEKEAATDKEKILIKDSTPDQITAGVRFATPKDWRPLDDAIKSVENQERIGFASQQKCDDTAKTLQAAIDDFIQNKVKVGTSKTTDAYILQKVKDELLNTDRGVYAYSSKLQPLKPGSAYPLYMGSWTAGDGVYVNIQWTATGEGAQYVTKIEDSSGDLGHYELDGISNLVTRGALIGSTTPKQPKQVTFTATVKNSQNDHVIGTLDYPATIGAPISATLPSGTPQFTTTRDSTSTTGATKFTGVVPITLHGADAIKSVPSDCVTMANSNTESNADEVSFRTITVDKVEKSGDVLNVTVSVITGGIGGVWNENSSVPKFSEGILPNIAIDTSNFQLKENTLGWYLPTDALNLGNMTVDVLTPAFTGVEHADDPTTGKQTFTIHTQNMPENAKVEVALAKKDAHVADIEQSTIQAVATRVGDGKYSVTFNKNDFEPNTEYYIWLRYGSPGSDWAYESVTNRPTYTPNSTTGGGSDSSESGSGNTTEGSQAGA
ncbi:MAG: S-layer homology domain-containing protein [Gallintestinimicrobium sp.]|uniref:S-layer homology domain-containing protein n=1 Tax=Gallintestinimicrobium sp. TaxID=2981655 RepID=UPI00399B3295